MDPVRNKKLEIFADTPKAGRISHGMGTRPIGVFDSGVGGLSVLREIQTLLPNEHYIFVADQNNVPYGSKTTYQLCRLCDRIVRQLLQRDVKLVVIACNTATCYAIDYLRGRYPSLLCVGTVPAIKPAAQQSVCKSIAVLSTPATSRSPYLKKLIQTHASDMRVVNVGCPGLENAVEKGDADSSEVQRLLKKYLRKATVGNPDYLVLGCTHYPFLKRMIGRLTSSSLKTIDSGSAIARRVQSLLFEHNLLNGKEGSTTYFTTGDVKSFSHAASRLLNTAVKGKQLLL